MADADRARAAIESLDRLVASAPSTFLSERVAVDAAAFDDALDAVGSTVAAATGSPPAALAELRGLGRAARRSFPRQRLRIDADAVRAPLDALYDAVDEAQDAGVAPAQRQPHPRPVVGRYGTRATRAGRAIGLWIGEAWWRGVGMGVALLAAAAAVAGFGGGLVLAVSSAILGAILVYGGLLNRRAGPGGVRARTEADYTALAARLAQPLPVSEARWGWTPETWSLARADVAAVRDALSAQEWLIVASTARGVVTGMEEVGVADVSPARQEALRAALAIPAQGRSGRRELRALA